MTRIVLLVGALALLCGCGEIMPAADPLRGYATTGCGAIARQQADDAAMNGYDTGVRARVAHDALTACQVEMR